MHREHTACPVLTSVLELDKPYKLPGSEVPASRFPEPVPGVGSGTNAGTWEPLQIAWFRGSSIASVPRARIHVIYILILRSLEPHYRVRRRSPKTARTSHGPRLRLGRVPGDSHARSAGSKVSTRSLSHVCTPRILGGSEATARREREARVTHNQSTSTRSMCRIHDACTRTSNDTRTSMTTAREETKTPMGANGRTLWESHDAPELCLTSDPRRACPLGWPCGGPDREGDAYAHSPSEGVTTTPRSLRNRGSGVHPVTMVGMQRGMRRSRRSRVAPVATFGGRR
jgi:hypothetical protein